MRSTDLIEKSIERQEWIKRWNILWSGTQGKQVILFIVLFDWCLKLNFGPLSEAKREPKIASKDGSPDRKGWLPVLDCRLRCICRIFADGTDWLQNTTDPTLPYSVALRLLCLFSMATNRSQIAILKNISLNHNWRLSFGELYQSRLKREKPMDPKDMGIKRIECNLNENSLSFLSLRLTQEN